MVKILFMGGISEAAGRRLFPLLLHSIDKGNELAIITNTDTNFLYKYFNRKTTKIYRLTAKKSSNFPCIKLIYNYIFLSFKLLIVMRNVLKDFPADVIFEQNASIPPRCGCYLFSKLFRKKYIIDFNDFISEKHENNLIVKIERFFHNAVVKGADRIITTDFIKEYCISIGVDPKKIDVIACAADPSIFNKNISYIDITKKYELTGFNIILYAGYLCKTYGILDLIDAIFLVIQKHKQTKLILAGWEVKEDMQEFRDKIKKYNIENNVIFVGLQPYEEIPRFINASDICVNPFPGSKYCRAGSPIKVFEYMLCGKPVVHSDIDSVKDVIIDGKTGLLYEPDNIKDLADKINKLIENPELRKKLGENAEKLILEKHTWDKLGDQLIESFYKTLDNK